MTFMELINQDKLLMTAQEERGLTGHCGLPLLLGILNDEDFNKKEFSREEDRQSDQSTSWLLPQWSGLWPEVVSPVTISPRPAPDIIKMSKICSFQLLAAAILKLEIKPDQGPRLASTFSSSQSPCSSQHSSWKTIAIRNKMYFTF